MTNCLICKETEIGNILFVYCHKYGNPYGVGRLLVGFYDTAERVDALLNLGDIALLGEKFIPSPDAPHTFEKPQERTTVAYMRDRGDTQREAKVTLSLKDLNDNYFVNYIYVFTKEGRWKYFEVHKDFSDEQLIDVKDYLLQFVREI